MRRALTRGEDLTRTGRGGTSEHTGWKEAWKCWVISLGAALGMQEANGWRWSRLCILGYPEGPFFLVGDGYLFLSL